MVANLVWGGLLGALVAAELVGLRGAPHRTLTQWLRRILGIEPRRWWRPVGIAGFLAFFAWFLPHIIFGIWG